MIRYRNIRDMSGQKLEDVLGQALVLLQQAWPSEQVNGYDLAAELRGKSKDRPEAAKDFLIGAFEGERLIAFIGAGKQLGPTIDGVWAEAVTIGYDDTVWLPKVPELVRHRLYDFARGYCLGTSSTILICTEHDYVARFLTCDGWEQELDERIISDSGADLGATMVLKYPR